VKHAYLGMIILAGCQHAADARSLHAPTLTRIAEDRPPQVGGPSQRPALQASLVRRPRPSPASPSVELVKTLGSVIDARCNGVLSPPSEQIIVVQGQPIKQRCGLLSQQFRQADYENYVTHVCNDVLEAVSPECMQAWYGRFITGVMARYSAADWRTFPAWCESHPSDCDDLPKTEIWFLSSHSTQLYAAYNEYIAKHTVQQ
jgi:hypothetical protein